MPKIKAETQLDLQLGAENTQTHSCVSAPYWSRLASLIFDVCQCNQVDICVVKVNGGAEYAFYAQNCAAARLPTIMPTDVYGQSAIFEVLSYLEQLVENHLHALKLQQEHQLAVEIALAKLNPEDRLALGL